MWNLERNDTNELTNRNRLTVLDNELWLSRVRMGGEGIVREFGMDMY